MATTRPEPEIASGAIQQDRETVSNNWRLRCANIEPHSQRTYTPSQLVIQHSFGAYHRTSEGHLLADFTSGVLVANLGHNPVGWWERVRDYMGLTRLPRQQEYATAIPLTAYNAITPLEVLASERLLENVRSEPGGERLERVIWAASGSEAIQKALWCAMKRQPARHMVLATRRGFHGKKGLAGAVTGCEEDTERDDRVRFISFPCEESRDLTTTRNAPDLRRYQQELQELGQSLGDRLCAVVTEPYLGGGGSYHPHPSYLQLLSRFCDEHDLVLILDEIQSCFGGTGPMYAFTRYGIEPDVVCLGKGMGNGMPVSAVVGRSDVLDTLDYGECSDTWSGNPISSAAVLATLDLFETSDVLQRGSMLSEVLEDGLMKLKKTGVLSFVRGEGCVWGLECCAVGRHTANQVANACVQACYQGDDQGRRIHLLGPLAGCVLRVSPPLIMDPAEARDYLQVMETIFRDVYQRLSSD